MNSKVTVVLGAQWGDEGKGKVVDLLAEKSDYVCRCQGGSNAGHTVVVNGVSYHFHLIPSGLLNRACTAVIGNGVVIHLETFIKEIEELRKNGVDTTGRIWVSDRAHIVFGFHQETDGYIDSSRGDESIGTTKKGIGPAYSSKMLRNGIRVCDLLQMDSSTFRNALKRLVEFNCKQSFDLKVDIDAECSKYTALANELRPFVCDTVKLIHTVMSQGKKVLVECANGYLLDIDLGTYPYVTSSNTCVAGALTGLGIPPRAIGHINIVVKAYSTRVGEGPFPTEELGEIGNYLRTKGKEYGTTTGRPRRCGWLDLALIKNCIRTNGADSITLTKLDILEEFDEIKVGVGYTDQDGVITDYFPPYFNDFSAKYSVVYNTLKGWRTDISRCTSFDQLPQNCQDYVSFIETQLGVPVKYIGVGAARDKIIIRD